MKRFYLYLAVSIIVAITLGCYAASEVITSQNGYVAGFIYFPLLVLIGVAALILLLGAITSAVRGRQGTPFIVSGLLLPASFFITLMLANHYQWGAYREDPMVLMEPEIANIVLFAKNATHDQIENFWEETLSTKREDGKGHDHLPGVRGITRFSPRNGHEVGEFDFFDSATDEQREYVYSRVRSSPVVFKLLENVPIKSYILTEDLPSNDNRPKKEMKTDKVTRNDNS